ncbi:MAG: LysR family transcriptional regulator [Rhodospirillaceae bacterium]|nr:LysR family transcriptional regulator [Rhodospirillaceae bacterium]
MTLEQLRIFIAVAEKEHVTQAALQLNLTQSATSAAIAALESRYGVKLFDRVGRGIALTQTGRAFLAEARGVIARARTAEAVLHDLSGLKHGSLSIAASQTVGNYWLPARLYRFQEAHPGISLNLSIANTEQVAQQVRNGSANLGLVEGEIDDPLLNVHEIDGDSLVVVVGATHPWVKNPPRLPEGLLEGAWILRERGSGTRAMFETALRGFGVDPAKLDIRIELPSNEAIRAAIVTGSCATAISNLAVTHLLAAGKLHRVEITLPKRAFYVLRHRERYSSNAERALLSDIGLSDIAPNGD